MKKPIRYGGRKAPDSKYFGPQFPVCLDDSAVHIWEPSLDVVEAMRSFVTLLAPSAILPNEWE